MKTQKKVFMINIKWHDSRHMKCIWKEDDAQVPDKESLAGAWKRIFKEDLPGSDHVIDKVDHGDCLLYLVSGNRIFERSCEQDAIYMLEESAKTEDTGVVELSGGSPVEAHVSTQEEERGLSSDQSTAMDALFAAISRGERVLVLTGAAGTGKTFLMGFFAREARSLGWKLVYLAPTGKAALKLSQSVKTQASTVHSRLYKTVTENVDGDPVFSDPQPVGSERTIVICDEASMISEYIHKDLVRTLYEGSVLLYVGDREQIEPVVGKWGPDFDHPTAVLERVHRQALGSPIIQVATILRTGGKLPTEDIGEAYKRPSGSLKLAAQWMSRELGRGEDAVVLSWTNDARHRVNKLVRHQMGYHGKSPLEPGEQAVVLYNNKFLQRNNGETFIVESIAPFGNHGILKVKAADGRLLFVQRDLIGSDLSKFKAWCEKHKNAFDVRMVAHIDYGYGLTIHKSQGSEYEKVLVILDGKTKWVARRSSENAVSLRRLLYTAATRAKKQLIILDAP